MSYTAPYKLSDEYVPIPPEGTFLLPVCTTADRLAAILSALYYGGLNIAEPGDMTHLVDVLNAIPRIRPECELEPTGCTTWTSAEDRVTFYPTQDATDLPLGYVVNPWVQITGDNPLVGLKRGDVISDILHMPILPTIWDNLNNPLYLMTLGYPTITIDNLVGAGSVRVYMVGIILGGKCMVIRDLDPFSVAFLDTNIDTGSLPPETYAEQILEYEFEGVGTHRLDIVFFPNASLDIEFLGYGAGFRRVEICGFEENEMTEPCCDDEIDILKQILGTLKDGFTIMPRSTSIPPDFTVDCTPPDFTGDPEQTPPVAIMRRNALCLTVARWLVSAMGAHAIKMNQRGKLTAIWAKGGFTTAPEMFANFEYQPFTFSVALLNIILESDTAFNKMVCLIMDALQTERSTFVNFKKKMNDAYLLAIADAEPAMPVIGQLANEYAQNEFDYRLFAQELENSFSELENGLIFDCACISDEPCDPANFDLIAVNDCIVTRIDDTHWRIQQTNFTDAPPDKRAFTAYYRDRNWKCFNVVSYNQGYSGYDVYTCAGAHLTGNGGGGGSVVQDGIIFLEYDTDPVVGLDIIAYVICP